ncbi:hypothetical protein BVX94_01655 [bacterium B17]|nr:hypothetical protein BVX94_01655 [bacterium B17]
MKAFFLVGPTAVGKTSVAQYIAENDGSEILSADSMIVYNGMDIGTAKPTEEEQSKVVYHGLDIIEPTELYNAGRYREYALKVIKEASGRGSRTLVVGGTGLYVKVLTDGIDQEWSKDPAYAPIAGLRMPTDVLAERIRTRVHDMYEQGFEEEVAGLIEKHGKLSGTAEKAIGYAEVLDILNGRISREEAIEKTIVRTRQFAKRQMTWFRHQALIKWIDISPEVDLEEVARLVIGHWEEWGPTDIKEK